MPEITNKMVFKNIISKIILNIFFCKNISNSISTAYDVLKGFKNPISTQPVNSKLTQIGLHFTFYRKIPTPLLYYPPSKSAIIINGL